MHDRKRLAALIGLVLLVSATLVGSASPAEAAVRPPGPPSITGMARIAPKAFMVVHHPPSDTGGAPIQAYAIGVWKDGRPLGIVAGCDCGFTNVINMEPGFYQAQVKALNSAGWGEFSVKPDWGVRLP